MPISLRPLLLSLTLFAVLSPTDAQADTERFAVVVGHNTGAGEREPLTYAEVDAGKLARVLVDLGNVKPKNLALLQGQSLTSVTQALETMRRRIRRAKSFPGRRVVVLFYYSGHSDGVALELADQRLPFKKLKRWLKGTGADVRVMIVDSCKSGSLLAAKGARRGPDFDIVLADKLNTKGEVILTSSAADEIALESKEVGGSFFTHHLVSGMRGAADASKDGRVTLSEAYRYAYSNTVQASGATISGAQHPSFDYRLSGRGELTLTDLNKSPAIVRLPKRFDRAMLVNLRRDQVEAELSPNDPRDVAVMPGRYALYVWRKNNAFIHEFDIEDGETQKIRQGQLTLLPDEEVAVKGGRAVAGINDTLARPWALAATVGVLAPVTPGPMALGSAGLSLERRYQWFEAQLGFLTGTGRGDNFRETQGRVWLAGGVAWRQPRLSPFAQVGIETGWVGQSIDGGMSRQSAVFGVRGAGGARFRLSPQWDLTAALAWSQLWVRVDSSTDSEGLWSALTSAAWRF